MNINYTNYYYMDICAYMCVTLRLQYASSSLLPSLYCLSLCTCMYLLKSFVCTLNATKMEQIKHSNKYHQQTNPRENNFKK